MEPGVEILDIVSSLLICLHSCPLPSWRNAEVVNSTDIGAIRVQSFWVVNQISF